MLQQTWKVQILVWAGYARPLANIRIKNLKCPHKHWAPVEMDRHAFHTSLPVFQMITQYINNTICQGGSTYFFTISAPALRGICDIKLTARIILVAKLQNCGINHFTFLLKTAGGTP